MAEWINEKVNSEERYYEFYERVGMLLENKENPTVQEIEDVEQQAKRELQTRKLIGQTNGTHGIWQ